MQNSEETLITRNENFVVLEHIAMINGGWSIHDLAVLDQVQGHSVCRTRATFACSTDKLALKNVPLETPNSAL